MVTPLSRTASFPADPGSIAEARRFAAKAVAPLHPELCDAVSLLVSELATNAIRHGESTFAVEVEALADCVRVKVSDAGEGWPTTADTVPTDTRGRGLRIVDAFADNWGVFSDKRAGKTVWFELSAGGGGAGGDGMRPRRR